MSALKTVMQGDEFPEVPNRKATDAAYGHLYRIQALCDALRMSSDMQPSSASELASMAKREAERLLDCLNAITGAPGPYEGNFE